MSKIRSQVDRHRPVPRSEAGRDATMNPADQSNPTVDLLVERLFKENPPRNGQWCQNPVTGYWYLGKLDPIAPQKRDARRALRARERFAIHGPQDAQPLPLSNEEIVDSKYNWKSKNPALSYIVSRFAASLRNHEYDFESHPSFEDFASGVLASPDLPHYFLGDEALCKRYPPHPLPGLDAGNCWEPPERH
jgi:hypothetical protein